jgi:hypothetical protein
MAAVLAAYPSVASHWSAAWLWGLLQSRPGTLHVTSRTGRHSRHPFEIHVADLAPADRVLRDGIPVTSVPRTILDISAGSRPKTIGRYIERADAAKVFDCARCGSSSIGGLPEPAMNVFVAGHELDAYWEDARFGVELDSYRTHGSRLSFEEDRVRVDDFLHAELVVTQVTETRLDREPDAVVDSLRRHLARLR